MSKFAEFIKALFSFFPSQKELDNAYLNQSVDIYDVERRMREIDSRSNRYPALQSSLGFNVQ